MKGLSPLILLIFSFALILISCADDTPVGYGLLGESDLELEQTDDFTIPVQHIAPIAINGLRVGRHHLGTLDDSVFGQLTASFSVRPVLGFQSPEFSGRFDSMVLSIQVDTNGFYGPPSATHDISVHLLNESIDDRDTILTDEIFDVSAEPVGLSDQYVDNNRDSLLFLDQFGDSTFFKNVLSVKIDHEIGQAIFDDTTNNKTFDGFNSLINGFQVKSISDNSLMSFDLSGDGSGLIVYYTDDSLGMRTYRYNLNALASPVHYEYNLTDSEVSNAITEGNDPELMYLQGFGGVTLEFDISDLEKLDNPFLNYAALEVYAISDSPIDTLLYPYPFSFDLMIRDQNGQLADVRDLEIAKATLLVDNLFGGTGFIDEGLIKYEMKITNFIKSFYDGEQPSKIYLTVRNRVENPRNIVLYGPNHSNFRARLNLTYTKS